MACSQDIVQWVLPSPCESLLSLQRLAYENVFLFPVLSFFFFFHCKGIEYNTFLCFVLLLVCIKIMLNICVALVCYFYFKTSHVLFVNGYEQKNNDYQHIHHSCWKPQPHRVPQFYTCYRMLLSLTLVNFSSSNFTQGWHLVGGIVVYHICLGCLPGSFTRGQILELSVTTLNQKCCRPSNGAGGTMLMLKALCHKTSKSLQI